MNQPPPPPPAPNQGPIAESGDPALTSPAPPPPPLIVSPSHHTTAPSSRRWLGFLAGLLLLAAAVYAVISHGQSARAAWSSLRSAPIHLIALAFLLPIANWLIISASFWLVTRRIAEAPRPPGAPPRARVGLWEMSRLIGAAWLLNYLPLRAGLLGRLAYHRAVNNIPLSVSIRIVIISMGCGLLAVLIVIMLAALVPPAATPALWSIALAAPPAVLLAWAATGAWHQHNTQSVKRTSKPGSADSDAGFTLCALSASWLPLNLLLRYADMLVWVLRYAVVFTLIGRPIGPATSAAVAGASQIAMTVPIFGNGLGLREWAVGLTAANLPADLRPGLLTGASAAGLAAELANRAAELAMAIPIGTLCSLSLLRARRAR